MKMEYYVVDVFTDAVFSGNPAGVCLLGDWLPDGILQNIAMENNLSETAFLVKRDSYYDLRWFTPEIEIDLCGHATMGSAYVLFTFKEKNTNVLEFHTQSGTLTVEKKGDMLWMNFPSRPATPAERYMSIRDALQIDEFEVYKSADLLVVLGNEDMVKQIEPNYDLLKCVKDEANMPGNNFGVIITAPGSDCDFVSRYFAPNAGVSEDPVTGRAHCVLIPYWSERLGKNIMSAKQLSKRGGNIYCEDAGERVVIGGKAALYLTGQISWQSHS